MHIALVENQYPRLHPLVSQTVHLLPSPEVHRWQNHKVHLLPSPNKPLFKNPLVKALVRVLVKALGKVLGNRRLCLELLPEHRAGLKIPKAVL